MGFLKKFQLGKVLGATARGFAQGGFVGAVAQGGAAAAVATAGAASSRAIVPSIGTSFVQPSSSFPGTTQGFGGAAFPVAQKRQDIAVAGSADGELFNILMKVADKLGIRIVNPNAVLRVGRNIIAKMLRFARATPGLTIVSMLANLGLSAYEANKVVSWYSTAGKKRRRIRVTNVKALNRSVRRLEGFMRLSRRVEASLGRKVASRSRRKCMKCRKSPCGC